MYEIIYDFCSEYSDEHNLYETFVGSFDELQDYLKTMKRNGCYNISVSDNLAWGCCG